MNQRTDHDELLDDVLTGETGRAAREVSLENLLRLARQRRRRRVMQRTGLVAALLVLSMMSLRWWLPHQSVQPETPRTAPAAPGLDWVASQPLAPAQLVRNVPLTPEQIVTAGQPPDLVRTMPGNFRVVGDAELLELAAPQIVALVRRGPQEMELVFVVPPAPLREN
jgi:hypothetical protein